MTRSRCIPATMAMAVVLAASAAPQRVEALAEVFTYQGQIQQGGMPVDGHCDVQFRLFGVSSGGTEVAPAVTAENLTISDGLFTAPLGFGSAPFDGADRYLEVAVRCPTGSGSYTTLAPRHLLTPAPYAFFAGTVNWNGIGSMPAGFADNSDADTLGGLTCTAGQIAKWTGVWGCGNDQDTTYSAGTGLTLSGGEFSVNTAQIQQRVVGTCGVGNAIRQINGDGSVVCESTGPAGDITAVTAGSGLTGGGESGGVALAANFTPADGVNGSASTVARGDHNHFGQTWSGSDFIGLRVNRTTTGGSTAALTGIDGPGSSFSLGNSAGVWGDSDTSFGVLGTSNSSAGVKGESATSTGVRGVSASATGVYGMSASANGVYGAHTGSTGTEPGVEGATNSTTTGAAGVVGRVESASGGDYSVGVRGINNATDPVLSYGVFGSANYVGVYGREGSGSGYAPGEPGAGVWGDSQESYGTVGSSSAAEGVVGLHAGSGKSPGVLGVTWFVADGSLADPGATGVEGLITAWSPGAFSIGVHGLVSGGSSNGIGVFGEHKGSGLGVVARSHGGWPIVAYGSSDSDIEFRVTNSGDVYADGAFFPGGADFAEMLPAAGEPGPGDVLALDEDGRLVPSTRAGQRTVAGVYSTKPGLLGGGGEEDDLAGKVPLAVSGVVPVKVTAENGPIRPGDLLIASSTPAHAMVAGPDPEAGTVIGKALTGLADGQGTVRMLVMLR